MILSAQSIRDRCVFDLPDPVPGQKYNPWPMIHPFCERTKAFGMTYGLGPAGYDVRIAQDLWLLPFSRLRLASTVERFHMPRDVLGRVADKSTWARRGLCVQNTIIEPGWQGYLTLELTNHGWRVLRIKAGMPIAQIIFEFLDRATAQPYAGKYQAQPSRPVPAIAEAT